mmetsp:Transcript_18314/g.59971  ORF Transcript_18314/g.59971 Transcript_18314/m.59971 type:complete len:241 (+) Transcript_18314:297-1019(+)
MLCSSAGSASPFGQPSHRYSASCRSPHPGSGLSRRAYCSGAKAHGTANLQPRPAAVAPRLALWCFASHILCISLSPECAVFRGSSLAFSAAALWIIEGQRQFACGAPRNGRALANLGGGAAVEPDLARSTASILAVELDPHARSRHHLADGLALLRHHHLVALLREGHLHLALWRSAGHSLASGKLVLPAGKVGIARAEPCGARSLLLLSTSTPAEEGYRHTSARRDEHCQWVRDKARLQ